MFVVLVFIHFFLSSPSHIHPLSVWAAADTSENLRLQSRSASETGSRTVSPAISGLRVSTERDEAVNRDLAVAHWIRQNLLFFFLL